MKKFLSSLLMALVVALGIFASVAAAADGTRNGNGRMPKGGTNTCQPAYHDEGGMCVHNGDAAGNCGQNQSGDTGNGNGSNQGNGGDKGYGNRGDCNTDPPPATPPAAPPPSASPGVTTTGTTSPSA